MSGATLTLFFKNPLSLVALCVCQIGRLRSFVRPRAQSRYSHTVEEEHKNTNEESERASAAATATNYTVVVVRSVNDSSICATSPPRSPL